MSNALAKNFNFLPLVKFTAPTIIMMFFMSLYTMVDGIFVSRFVGTDALSATNIVYPLFNIVIGIAVMLATGGSALIAKRMGQQNYREAKEIFSLITLTGFILGLLFAALGIIFIHPLLIMLGANDVVYNYCFDYIFIILIFTPVAILQMLFQYLFVTAGKPAIGLIITVAGGSVNVILDYVFIVLMNMGISGAAIATVTGFSIPAVYGLIYFFIKRQGTLYFVKPKFDFHALLKTCTNGAAEMVTNLSVAITTFLFNIMMMKYLGSNGVAAITIVLYAEYLLTAVFLGYASGIAPVFSYNYGNKNSEQLKKLFKISLIFLTLTSLLIYAASRLLSAKIATIFTEYGTEVFYIADNGFILFAGAFLFTGINIFASAMFTAFSNGKAAAIISFLRTFIFIIAAILIMPVFLGVTGIWLAVPAAEVLTVIISVIYFISFRTKYNYA